MNEIVLELVFIDLIICTINEFCTKRDFCRINYS